VLRADCASRRAERSALFKVGKAGFQSFSSIKNASAAAKTGATHYTFYSKWKNCRYDCVFGV
jgi:hypothetical protein